MSPPGIEPAIFRILGAYAFETSVKLYQSTRPKTLQHPNREYVCVLEVKYLKQEKCHQGMPSAACRHTVSENSPRVAELLGS